MTVNPPLHLIFDMDGVIVDSNPYHKLAWKQFCEKQNCALSEDDLRQHIYGRTNEDAVRYVFGNETPTGRLKALSKQKEELYRELFRPYLQPVTGLVDFLQHSRETFGVPAIATSAPPENLDFVLDTLKLRQYFGIIVDETMVSHGKPDPEIYLKTAAKLNVKPASCVVFEDSLSGIQSARSAGMIVVGVATTHSREELKPHVDLAIADFSALHPGMLLALQPA